MTSLRRKQPLLTAFFALLTLILALLVPVNNLYAQEEIKPSAQTISTETNNQRVALKESARYVNKFQVTGSGDLAKDYALDMLSRYPTLANNPFAILVKFTNEATEDEVKTLLDNTNSRIVDFYPTIDWYLIETSSGQLNTEREFKASPLVDEVELDNVNTLSSVNTNDPMIGTLWGLHGNHGIDAEVAWPLSSNASEVVVAVIDTGVDISHPDLADIIWTNENEIPNNGIDDDNNGYIDDISGWDFLWQDNIPDDRHGHGTHVAGTIAAIRNNNEGIAGVADNVKIMPIKILGVNAAGSEIGALDSQIAKAIEYAFQNGANISNNSWGGPYSSSAIQSAIAAGGSAGHLFVAAAGNSGSNADMYPMYPAAYNLTNILSVAAIASTGNLAGFSNYGVNSVDIAAPGVDILSTMSSESPACVTTPPCYVSWNGTSMAAPHAAGVAALTLGVNTGLTPEEIIQLIQDTARLTDTLLSKVKSGGELDGGAAVTLASQSSSIVFIDYTPGESVLEGSTISLTATATGLNNVDVSETIEWKDDQGTSASEGAR